MLVIISAFVGKKKKKMCQEMIIWQIAAGAQHNSFADTINVEPL